MPRPALSLLPLLLAAACGDIDVRSIRTGDIVPDALAGEWRGDWQSQLSGIQGLLTLRIQDFAGQPVVSVQIAHPCVPPDQYEFRVAPSGIELLEDGEVLFRAVFGDNRTLVGSYSCLADSGLWDATWTRDLPQLIDLGGRWVGTITVDGFPAQSLELQLDQSVQSSALAMQGTMALPGLLAEPLDLRGTVQFRDGAFDLLLVTAAGSGPLVHMLGTGATETRSVPNGSLQAVVGPQQPIVEATWQVQWVGP